MEQWRKFKEGNWKLIFYISLHFSFLEVALFVVSVLKVSTRQQQPPLPQPTPLHTSEIEAHECAVVHSRYPLHSLFMSTESWRYMEIHARYMF